MSRGSRRGKLKRWDWLKIHQQGLLQSISEQALTCCVCQPPPPSTTPTTSKSVSYPLRSWWAPEGAGAWWRQTPTPRCPPSVAPQFPRSRSASLPLLPTPHRHTRTRTRSPSQLLLLPGRRRDQDHHSHLAPHSSSPAPTPALRRPKRTGRAPPGNRLLLACSLNPLWVRLKLEINNQQDLSSGLREAWSH